MSLTIEQEQFFSLLRAGLWGEAADASLFTTDTDWRSIFTLANKQALLGIVFDGIQTLPRNIRPDRKLYLQWCSIIEQIEQENLTLNEKLKNIFSLYKNNGIIPILLKGQGVAQNYRNPEHRQCGDIDVYIRGNQYNIANTLLRVEGNDQLEECNRHTHIIWHGIHVENHRIISSLNEPRANRFFQKAITQWFPHGACETNINGYKVLVPPVDFNVVYILIHSVLHYLNEGVGLRQVCDWVCLLHAQQEKLDSHTINVLLQGTGMFKAAKAFGILAVTWLGFPEKKLPFQLDEHDMKRGSLLLEHIFQSGNFGKYDPNRKKRPKGYWSGKWNTFSSTWTRTRQFGDLAPAEARWRPLMMFLDFTKMQIKKRLS